MEEQDVIKRLKEFATTYKDEHETNIKDFKLSKNLASGNGFTVAGKKAVWNQNRAKVSVNLLEPVINSIVYKFTENPFDFKAKDTAITLPIELPELKFQLGSCLREACIDGISYLLAYKENDVVRFNRLNNFNVIYGECEFSDGQDVKEVVYIDKRDAGKDYRKSQMGQLFQSVLNLTKNEIPVITYWRKEGENVVTYKIENEEIVETVTQPLSRIPVVRIYAKEVFINYKRNYRGLYYLVKDVLRTIDLEMSLTQERIATAPNHLFWIAEETIGNNVEQLAKLNDIPTAFKTYKATNTLAPGVTLPPPTRNDLATNISDLTQSFAVHKEIVQSILGITAGETNGVETAEAVLLRRENKDTAVNDLIKNLLDSSHEIAALITDFTGFEVLIQSDIFEKAKQNDELQKIIALTQFINNNPHAYTVLPVLIAKLDVDMKSKQTMLQLFSQDRDVNQEMKAQIEALTMENTQLKAHYDSQLQTAIVNKEAMVAQKQIDAQIKQAEFNLKILELQQEAEFKGIELQQKGAIIDRNTMVETTKLMQNAEVEGAKLAQNAEKIANDFETKTAQILANAAKG